MGCHAMGRQRRGHELQHDTAAVRKARAMTGPFVQRVRDGTLHGSSAHG